MNIIPQKQMLHLLVARSTFDLLPLINDQWFFHPTLAKLYMAVLETIRDKRGCDKEKVIGIIQGGDFKEKNILITELANICAADLKYHESFLIDSLRNCYRDYIEEGLAHTLADKEHTTADSRADAIGAAYKNLTMSSGEGKVETLNDEVRSIFDEIKSGKQSAMERACITLHDTNLATMFRKRIWPVPYLIGAREKFRKTQTLLNLLIEITKNGRPGIFYTFEDSRRTVALKSMSISSSVDYELLSLGQVDPEKMKELETVYYGTFGKKMKVDPTSYSPEQWERNVRAQCMSERVDWIAIDFVQSFRYNRNHGAEVHELSRIGKIIREVCKEFTIPCITLSQVTKRDEEEDTGRVKLHIGNLKGSGALAEDARQVYLIDGIASEASLNWKCVKNSFGPLYNQIIDYHGPTGKIVDVRMGDGY
jgi:replicative DNA helicase